MTGERLRRLLPLALAAALVGCGQSNAPHVPDLARLPLVPGARVVVEAQQCDTGADSFCSVQLVIVDPRYRSSDDLLTGEHDRLIRLGWSGAGADTSDERAADSPGHKLRVTYATAFGDLKGIDLGWIRRSRSITLALSKALFQHSSALSVMLEVGSS